MVKSGDNGSSVAPFLTKCYEMVDDEATDSIISWTESNESFVIWDTTEFSRQLLRKYFKHSNFSSFIRQLNIYGFRKVDTDRSEYASEEFIKGKKHLLKNISRRKHSLGQDQHKLIQQQDEPVGVRQEIENFGLWKEVESLKTDKNALMQELLKLRQLQESADNKLLLLGDRLKGMEKNQQQMLSFLVMAMQSPGFLVQLLQPKENNWRAAEAGKNMLDQVMEDSESLASDRMIVKYQLPMDETPKPLLTPPTLNSENNAEFDPSDGMKDFFVNIDFMKMLMDEKFCSSENNDPFVLPDLPDDGVLEQLLGIPFIENVDSQEPIDSMEMEPTVHGTQMEKYLHSTERMEKSQNLETESAGGGVQLEKSQNLNHLTEQMGILASETL